MTTYRDDETREIQGEVTPTEAGNWAGKVWDDGDPHTRYFPTEAEADGWVRGELGLS